MCATALSAALFGVVTFIATCILNTISFAIVPCIIAASARSLWPLQSCAPRKNNQEARHSRCTQMPLLGLFSWGPGDTSLQIQPPAPLCLESTWVPSHGPACQRAEKSVLSKHRKRRQLHHRGLHCHGLLAHVTVAFVVALFYLHRDSQKQKPNPS